MRHVRLSRPCSALAAALAASLEWPANAQDDQPSEVTVASAKAATRCGMTVCCW